MSPNCFFNHLKQELTQRVQTSAKAKISRRFTGGEHIVSWFDLQMCSKVIEDVVIGQNTYDFLLVFHSNFGRILTFLRYRRLYIELTLLGDCDL